MHLPKIRLIYRGEIHTYPNQISLNWYMKIIYSCRHVFITEHYLKITIWSLIWKNLSVSLSSSKWEYKYNLGNWILFYSEQSKEWGRKLFKMNAFKAALPHLSYVSLGKLLNQSEIQLHFQSCTHSNAHLREQL